MILIFFIPEAPVNDAARKRNGSLPGMGGVYNTINAHLYHYAGNNPVKYTDPDGRINYAVQAKYLMDAGSWAEKEIKGYKKLISEEGCAITAAANIGATFRASPLDPSVINEKFVEGGIMNWAAAAPSLGPGLTASKTPGAFTISQYDKQAEDMENISATLVNVKYNDGNAPHWVGVTGTARENNKDYLIIAPTSTADRTVNEARQGQGWILRDDGTVLAPVDNVREYVTFQTKNAF